MKNNEVIAEKPFPNSGITRRLWTLGRLEKSTDFISLVNCLQKNLDTKKL